MAKQARKSAPTAARPRLPARATAIAALIVIVALAVAAATQIRQRMSAARVPALPELTRQPKAVGDHLRERHAAVMADPTAASTVGAFCVALHADLFYDQAARCYELADSLSPSEWRWTYYRALLDGERADRGPLAARLQRVVDRAPQFAPALLRLGDAAFKEAQYDRADDAWRRASMVPEPDRASLGAPVRTINLPVSAYASLGLARVALTRRDPDRARQILEQLVTDRPRFGSAFRLLSEAYSLLGRAADAARAIGRARHLPAFAPYADPLVDVMSGESRSSTFLLRQATEADLASDTPWSEFVTRRALEFDPDNPDVVSKLGRLLRTLGRSGEALEFLQRYSRMVPTDYQGVGQVGSCLSDLGRFDEAEPYLRRALDGLDDALSHYNLGALLSATGRVDEAVTEYQRALDRDSDDLDARGNLAAVLVRTGRLAQASREFVRLLESDPDNAVVHTNYGVLLLRLGREDQAAREFERALRLDPQLVQAAEALREIRR